MGGGSGWVLLTYSPRDKRLVNAWAADHTATLAGGTPILAIDMYELAYEMDFSEGGELRRHVHEGDPLAERGPAPRPVAQDVAVPGRCAGTMLAAALATTLFAVSPGGRAAEGGPLVLERTITLANVSGRIDHMAVDLARGRLFVAELGNGSVDVVDLARGNVIHRFTGLKDPQGVGYTPAADILAVASAGDGTVRLFTGKDFLPGPVVPLGDDADNVRVDPASGHLLVGYGGGGLAVIDPLSGAVLSRVLLAAHPEGFQIEPLSRRAFVNIPDDRQIAVVDLVAGRQVASWRMPGSRSNFPMAVDTSGKTVASVFRSPPRLLLLDAATGSIRQSLGTCGDADDVFFDEGRGRIYVTCGSGSIDTFRAADGIYRKSGATTTGSGARTSLFVAELDRLFVAQRAGLLGSTAAILVFRPAD